MKFGVLALDYDGTIADDRGIEPEVRDAIRMARDRGVVVVLVTGRRLAHLRADAGDLRFVDAIVAENGAVLAFPQAGRSTILGESPSERFIEDLRRRGVDFVAGDCIVEADATTAHTVLQSIRDLELPLVILFNRGRLMALGQAISKATGLREALRALRLSVHNCVGIGDGENDHQLLDVCEVGIAVGWGSKALQEVADEVLPGDGPKAVARLIRELAEEEKIPPYRIGRRRVLLGSDEAGHPVALTLRGRNVLIAGDARSGKSWIAGLLAEQIVLQHYCGVLIDPEGDYRSFEALPGVMVFGGDDPLPRMRELTRALRYPDVSVVVDLSKLGHHEKVGYVWSLLIMLKELRRKYGLPHRIVLDEAHYYLHGENVHELLDLELSGYTLITYRASMLHPDVLAATEAVIVTRETDPIEVEALQQLVGRPGDVAAWTESLANLELGEAALLPRTEEARGHVLKFRVAPRLTYHVRHLRKYLDVPVPDASAFVFAATDGTETKRARTVQEFVEVLRAAPTADLDAYLRRGDFSRWFADVFGDRPLARQIGELELEYRLSGIADPVGALVKVITDRYVPATREIGAVVPHSA